MADHDALEIRALSTLLRETLLRADRQYAYLLNPGDPGLVETLKALSSETASKLPAPGRKPVVSHANARAVHQSVRNVDDETLRAIAERGGLVGVVGFPGFVARAARPSLDDLIAHIEHIVRVAGIEHDVCGLEIAVHDRDPMGFLHCAADLFEDVERAPKRESPRLTHQLGAE